MNEALFPFSGSDPTGEITLLTLLEKIPLKMNCVSIGRIEKVNDDQTANISVIYNQDNGHKYPVLSQVPLLVLQGGGKYIKFPVKKDDKVLLLFCDRDISNWHALGNELQPLPSKRNHSLSDAIAICGVNSASAPLGRAGESAVQINGNDTGLVLFDKLKAALDDYASKVVRWATTATYVNSAGTLTPLAFTQPAPAFDITAAETPNIKTETT